MTKIPVWVDFANVPDYLYAEKGLKFLGDIVGKYQKLHPQTEKCIRMDVARALVTINFEAELTHSMVLQGDHGEVTIGVSYPWVPLKCTRCNKWGHDVTKCQKTTNQSVEEQKNTTDDSVEIQMPQGASTSSPRPNSDETSAQKDLSTGVGKASNLEEGWKTVGSRKSPRKSQSPLRNRVLETVAKVPDMNGFNALQNLENEVEDGEIRVREPQDTEVEDKDDTGVKETELAESENETENDERDNDTDLGLNNDSPAIDTTQPTETVMDSQPPTQTIRGRGRGRGRPRKQGVTHQDISAQTNKTSIKASFGKH